MQLAANKKGLCCAKYVEIIRKKGKYGLNRVREKFFTHSGEFKRIAPPLSTAHRVQLFFRLNVRRSPNNQDSPPPLAMNMDEESSLNHKNKKFCNDVACDNDKKFADNAINHSQEERNQSIRVSAEGLLRNNEKSGDNHSLDPNVPSHIGTHEPDECSSNSEAAATFIDQHSEVAVMESQQSNPTAKTLVQNSAGDNIIADSVDMSAVEDVNDKIDYSQASQYWKAVPATVDGMLGGFAHISSTDINGSSSLIKWIFNQREKPGHGRCVDCGAGIGRITQRLLQKHFGKVDLVEQSPEFVEKAKEIFANNSKIGEIYCMGLQDFAPSPGIYDVVWTQWVSGYLRDDDLIAFFRRMSESLKPNGVIVVKENFTTDTDESPAKTVLDAEDSSVTRPLALLLKLATAAGLNLLRLVQQRRFPKQLFKVYMIVFRPERYSAEALLE